MLSAEELESALAAGYESRSFECKGNGLGSDRQLLARVARACLSMGNLRDGGYVIIGIDDDAPQAMLPGLTPEELATWSYDDVATRLAGYCDPPLSFELAELSLSSGASVIVLHVHEFTDIPHLCGRDYGDVLREGALYIRSLSMPATVEIGSSVELRDLLDLAAEKRLRAYVETAERAGVRLNTDRPGAAAVPAPDDAAQFGDQSQAAWGVTELTDKVRSRGYWDVTIRPSVFDAHRVAYEQLDEIIPAAAVRLRGWPVPYANYDRRETLRGDDWVGQDVDAENVSHYEAWRFLASGQFRHLRAISADWRGQQSSPFADGEVPLIQVWEILFYLSEVFELAARLALGPAGADEMVITAELAGLQGRALIVGQDNRTEFSRPYLSQVSSLTRQTEIARDRLISDPSAAAAGMAREFFLRFGWKPAPDQVLDHQRDLLDHRR